MPCSGSVITSTVPTSVHVSPSILTSTRIELVAGTVRRAAYPVSMILPLGAPLSGLVSSMIDASSTSTTKTFGSTGKTSGSSVIGNGSDSDMSWRPLVVTVRTITASPAKSAGALQSIVSVSPVAPSPSTKLSSPIFCQVPAASIYWTMIVPGWTVRSLTVTVSVTSLAFS